MVRLWHSNWDNIVALCRFLHDIKCVKADEIVYAMENPSKYTDEYKEMKELESEENDVE